MHRIGFKPFKWFGGKGRLVKRILPYIPLGGDPYVEPYAGSLAVLLARPPALSEVANDIDDRVINLFRVLQDSESFGELMKLLRQTSFSRAEFVRAIELANGNVSPIVRAWAFMVMLNQGFAGYVSRITSGCWGRNLIYSSNVRAWNARLSQLHTVIPRLRNVNFECRDGVECIKDYDNPNAVIYVDPPYVMDKRINKGKKYTFDNVDHDKIIDTLLSCKGAVALSNYDHPIFNRLTDNGWHKIQFDYVLPSVGRTRINKYRGEGNVTRDYTIKECLWLNPRAMEMLEHSKSLLTGMEERET